jgi:hypothetical protein
MGEPCVVHATADGNHCCSVRRTSTTKQHQRTDMPEIGCCCPPAAVTPVHVVLRQKCVSCFFASHGGCCLCLSCLCCSCHLLLVFPSCALLLALLLVVFQLLWPRLSGVLCVSVRNGLPSFRLLSVCYFYRHLRFSDGEVDV